ncbi:unnamed protein product, partial [Scytosiphon promiscuus]
IAVGGGGAGFDSSGGAPKRGGRAAFSATSASSSTSCASRHLSAPAAAGVGGGGGTGGGGLARGAQWWRGASVGAISALFACFVGTLLLAGGTEREGVRSDERCPVFNPVTGETTVPAESPPKPVRSVVMPGTDFPIQSEEWFSRVYKAKAAKSQDSKGALPEEVGMAAITRRLMARLVKHRRREEAEEQARRQNHPPPQPQQLPRPKESGGGIAAVLTLLRTDAGEPPQRAEQRQHFLSVLGERWTSPERAESRGPEGHDGWEEIVVCEEDASVVGG